MIFIRSAVLFASLAALSVLAACDNPQEKQAKYMNRGDQYFARADYVHARLEYKNAAKINPTDPKVIYSLGLVEEAQGNLQAALSAFLTAEQQDKNFIPVVQKLAEFFLIAQQEGESKARVDRLLVLDPNNAMAHALNASLYLKGKSYEAAQQEVDKALSLDQKNIVAYSVQSGIYKAKAQPEKALESLDQGIALNPTEISLYLLKAIIYADEADTNAVEDVYHKIFELSPDKIRYHFDLAQILTASKAPVAAEKILRDTVEKFPDNEDAKKKLIELLERNEGLAAAEAQIKTYLQTSPDRTELYLWLAQLYVKNERNDLAISALKNIIDTPGEEWVGLTANTSMARIRLSQGDIRQAQKLIDMVLEKDANNNEALLLRANLASAQGDQEEALGNLRNVIRDNPSSAPATHLMTELLLAQGHQDLAIDTLIQYHDHAPNDLGAQVRLAQLYALNGNTKPAFDILDNITQDQPDFALAWESLARLAIENKAFARAQIAIQKLGDMDGQAAVALFLNGQNAAAQGQEDIADGFYKSLITGYPASPLLAHALSGLLADTRTPQEMKALEDFLQTQKSQENPAISSVLGGIQSVLGDNDAAVQSLRNSIALKPDNQAPYLSLAQILKSQGDWQEAESVLDQAEAALPFEPKASLMKADMMVAHGEIDSALAIYETLLAQNKGSDISDVIANNYAQAIADNKADDKNALEKARLVAERFINSDNPYYLDTLGWVYYKQGNIAGAEPLIKKAKSLLKGDNVQIENHLKALSAH